MDNETLHNGAMLCNLEEADLWPVDIIGQYTHNNSAMHDVLTTATHLACLYLDIARYAFFVARHVSYSS